LSINNIIKVKTLNVQSKGRYLLLKKKDYNKRLVGTTQHSSRVSDIPNPKMYINPALGSSSVNVEKRKSEYICESAQTLASIFSHAIESHSLCISQQFLYE